MKKVLLILACGIAAQLSYAQATPKWAGKAKKAVFSIVTYDKDNKIKNTGNGFYINENGEDINFNFHFNHHFLMIHWVSSFIKIYLIFCRWYPPKAWSRTRCSRSCQRISRRGFSCFGHLRLVGELGTLR